MTYDPQAEVRRLAPLRAAAAALVRVAPEPPTMPDVIEALARVGVKTYDARHAIEQALETGEIRLDSRLHLVTG